ncbi:anti-sigma factor family protein [Stigmatella aurantiaca]|uniref:Transmembrane regulator PrtR n=1 Tax=Stigmatella aurantiaca (strain DW4/3-1) TaxID=378806 RepID=E3FYR2_STIAD|nr:zf-HC2 domain-containing protein [Stigmatella aurantiaca]ADO72375.1 transmembrane regulator PrtR [Stigmatella aurantiaca DW4/3-1]
MTCQELDRLLYPYLDGEFQPEERIEVETHLATCESCTLRVEQESAIRQVLRRAANHSVQSRRAPASLRAGIQLGMKQEHRRAQQLQWLRMGAAALVVAAVGGAWVTTRPEERLHFVEEAVRRHSKRLPFEIANVAPEHVEAWFDGKLDHPVPVPRLRNVSLSGARISNIKDRPAAYISYEAPPQKAGEEGRRIGVFVFDDARQDLDAQALPAVQVDSSNGYNVAVWREGEIVYELVSDLDEADIRKLLMEKELRLGNVPLPQTPSLPIRPASHVP